MDPSHGRVHHLEVYCTVYWMAVHGMARWRKHDWLTNRAMSSVSYSIGRIRTSLVPKYVRHSMHDSSVDTLGV